MKLLITYGSLGKFFHLKEFSKALKKLGVETRLVKDTDYSTGFPSKNPQEWFRTNKKFSNLINEFSPDVVFIDRQSHFGIDVIKAKIPLFVLLRGNLWMEVEWAKKTIYKDLKMRTVANLRHKIAERVFRNCQGIFTADFLHDVIKERFPNARCYHFLEGLNVSNWYSVRGMKLEHPCVGMLQDSNWWGKTKEMLILDKVMKGMPNVHFYWAGDGQYKNKILSVLEKHSNFHYLGSLQYPDKVREYFSEIDVYALPTGMDTLPLSCKEAMAMQNPVIATNVGGIPEMIDDNKTGFLINKGDYKKWIEKLSLLIKDKELSQKIGGEARKFVIKKFSWDIVAKQFVDIIESCLRENATKKHDKNSYSNNFRTIFK